MAGKALLGRLQRERHDQVIAPTSRQFDLRDPSATQRMFAEQPVDHVFHLAGYIGGSGRA
jgi:dTDP-4-dehydrorhamnose reductase